MISSIKKRTTYAISIELTEDEYSKLVQQMDNILYVYHDEGYNDSSMFELVLETLRDSH